METGDDNGGTDEGKRAVFRVPGIAMLAVALLLVCITPVAATWPGLLVLYVLPLGLAVWIVRTRTVATRGGLTVRTVRTTRHLAWDDLKGFAISPRAAVKAVRKDDTSVSLPAVRTRHLPVLSLVSEGRVPDPSGVLAEATAEAEAADEPADEATGEAADTKSDA